MRGPHRILHISANVTSDFAGVRAQLLEQLVRLHQVDERLETLALLIDFLVLSSLK